MRWLTDALNSPLAREAAAAALVAGAAAAAAVLAGGGGKGKPLKQVSRMARGMKDAAREAVVDVGSKTLRDMFPSEAEGEERRRG
jgi:hypothetical protein